MTSASPLALAILTDAMVDYAGLFPPAALDMPDAVTHYAQYRTDPHHALLGRFVVPVARLSELAQAAAAKWGKPLASPWSLTALAGAEALSDAQCIVQFNAAHRGRAIVDVVEAKASSPNEVEALAHAFRSAPVSLQLYIEVPLVPDPTPLIAAVAQAGVRAKIRTGGVTPEAFPPAAQIIQFMLACGTHKVPFKATAGLHHPIRSQRRLTYAPDSPTGTMYGFLNVFLAAAFLQAGRGAAEATQVLNEVSSDAFQFDDAGITWHEHHLTIDQLQDTRQHFALSFGSCSFREPVDDLIALHLL